MSSIVEREAKARDEAAADAIRTLGECLEDHRRHHSDESAHQLSLDLLTSWIGTLVYTALCQGKAAADENHGDRRSFEAFQNTKALVSLAVEDGFTHAFYKFNPAAAPEYECSIQLLASSVGRTPEKDS